MSTPNPVPAPVNAVARFLNGFGVSKRAETFLGLLVYFGLAAWSVIAQGHEIAWTLFGLGFGTILYADAQRQKLLSQLNSGGDNGSS